MTKATNGEWKETRLIVEQALELPEQQRSAFIHQACSNREHLAESVASLLECDRTNDTFLECPNEINEFGHRKLDKIDEQLIGQTLGNFRVTDLIGYGGMGVVYKAVRCDDLYQQQVAIKLVRYDIDSEEARERFALERETLAKLEHPYICRLLDGGATESGTPYVVIEYVEGESVDTYCDQNRLTIHQRLKLFEQICSAVQFAHQNFIIHRDLKPRNILVTASGTPKLLDFGMCRLFEDGILAIEGHRRSSGMTVRYACPELIQGKRATTASDVFSLGVILYELLSGCSPFNIKNASSFAIARAVCDDSHKLLSELAQDFVVKTGTLAPHAQSSLHVVAANRDCTLSRLRRALRGDLDCIVAKALNKDPNERYASVEQLVEDLRRLKNGHPVTAGPATMGYRSGKFIRRNRWPVAAATCFAVLLIVVATVSSVGLRRVSAAKDRADEQARRAGIVSRFLQETFAAMDPDATSPNELSARQLVDDAAHRLEELEEDDALRAEIGRTIGVAYFRLGAISKAEAQLQKASRRLARDPNGDAREATKINVTLASYYRANGKIAHSENLLVQTLPIASEQFGENAPIIANIMHSLGAARLSLSRYGQAKQDVHAALNILKQQPMPDSRAIGRAQSTLALIYRRLGGNDEAETLLRESISNFRKRPGEGRSDLAISLSNLGNLLRTRGRLQEAQAALEEAISIQRILYQGDHIDLATALNNLSLVLLTQYRLTEAEPILRESLEMTRAVLGSDSPQLAIGMSNLSMLLRMQSRYADAEPILREAIAIRQGLFDSVDTELARMFGDLGHLMILLEREEEAVEPIDQAMAINRIISGAESLEVAKTQSLKAQLAHVQARYKESSVMQSEVVQAFESAGEGNHVYVGNVQYLLADSYFMMREFDLARVALEKSLFILSLSLPDEHVDLARTRSLLGATHFELGNPDKAMELLRCSLKSQCSSIPESSDHAATEQRLAKVLMTVGKLEEARDLVNSSVNRIRRLEGEDNDLTRQGLKLANDLYQRMQDEH